jgi:alkanesulfonate monooxygenase SsuD/methylene tetrahydromethanopterin reductase-like flavin-dependent oxidoreductase (luciferase family)
MGDGIAITRADSTGVPPPSAAQYRVGHGEPDGRPFRLSFLLHLDSDQPPAAAYRDAIRLFVVAEELGYDCGWVIQRHFRQGNEHVSSPLVMLAAIAQHTTRIGLGTGVLVLPLADPLAVAEDAALLDSLSAGRLQLGVGSGPFPMAWEAFGRDPSERHRLFDDSVRRLHAILEGAPLNSAGEVLHPPAAGLRSRVWQATTSDPSHAVEAATDTARAGDGLQFSRAKLKGQTASDQAALIEAYRGAWVPNGSGAQPCGSAKPRVQVSRALYPHKDRRSAIDAVTAGVRRWQTWLPPERGLSGLSVEEFITQDQTLIGPAETIAEGLSADPALVHVTDLLVSFVPGVPDFAEHVRLLAASAHDIAPLLGWHPADAAIAQSAPPGSGRVAPRRPRSLY